jgi:hypothetical protein
MQVGFFVSGTENPRVRSISPTPPCVSSCPGLKNLAKLQLADSSRVLHKVFYPIKVDMKHFIMSALCAIMLASSPAMAGTPVLGAEIGVTTVEQLRQALSKNTQVQDQGLNRYSGGQMLRTDGASYEIEGLSEVLYIFDTHGKLAGVLMEMEKSRFASVYQFIGQKYKVSSERRPFVGDQYARFKSSDATIEIDAPHLSFKMEVRYLRNDLLQRFNADSAKEKAAKKKSEAQKF